MRLRFRADFNPLTLSWGGPDEPAAEHCSICETPIREEDMPLILWREDGWCVRLCEGCVRRTIEPIVA